MEKIIDKTDRSTNFHKKIIKKYFLKTNFIRIKFNKNKIIKNFI